MTLSKKMLQSGRDDSVTKRHKNNFIELYGFLNKEFCITQVNNSYESINFQKRDDNGRVSTQPPNFLASLKSNKIQVLINDETPQQGL